MRYLIILRMTGLNPFYLRFYKNKLFLKEGYSIEELNLVGW